jgi:hypothetical protein
MPLGTMMKFSRYNFSANSFHRKVTLDVIGWILMIQIRFQHSISRGKSEVDKGGTVPLL